MFLSEKSEKRKLLFKYLKPNIFWLQSIQLHVCVWFMHQIYFLHIVSGFAFSGFFHCIGYTSFKPHTTKFSGEDIILFSLVSWGRDNFIALWSHGCNDFSFQQLLNWVYSNKPNWINRGFQTNSIFTFLMKIARSNKEKVKVWPSALVIRESICRKEKIATTLLVLLCKNVVSCIPHWCLSYQYFFIDNTLKITSMLLVALRLNKNENKSSSICQTKHLPTTKSAGIQ